MRMTQLVGRTLREAPRDAELPSHRYLVRGGYIKQYSSGIYGFLPLAWRSLQKIEAICRSEMNSLGAQELRMPTMTTRELWEETGRYSNIGKEMFRFKDRHDKDHLLCMTHEEPVVAIARTELTSYKQLPAMVYQFQTKFRDEPRPRGGLVRTREFIMKDGYSFHADEGCLLKFYDQVHKAYDRFYKRVGFKNFASVRSDNGIFGGNFSHEFMALVPTGEDTLMVCGSCNYKANLEVATTQLQHPNKGTTATLNVVATPGAKTIPELVAHLRSSHLGFETLQASETCKAVLFQTVEAIPGTKPKLICAFVRGDRDVTEQKIVSLLGKNLTPATNETITAAGAVAGSAGPLIFKDSMPCGTLPSDRAVLIFDQSLAHEPSLVVGANREGEHAVGFNLGRDVLEPYAKPLGNIHSHILVADITQVVAGDSCPSCGKPLGEARGIEIGNIFHLGTKYSHAMGATFLDKEGKQHDLVMGCYGIGITRALAALAEEHYDDHGMILPLPVAPFEVHLNALNLGDDLVRQTATELYAQLSASGVEVLFDDRDEKPGSQFADADLIGIPLRVIVAGRSLKAGIIEFKYREKTRPAIELPLGGGIDDLVHRIKELVAAEHKRYEVCS